VFKFYSFIVSLGSSLR